MLHIPRCIGVYPGCTCPHLAAGSRNVTERWRRHVHVTLEIGETSSAAIISEWSKGNLQAEQRQQYRSASILNRAPLDGYRDHLHYISMHRERTFSRSERSGSPLVRGCFDVRWRPATRAECRDDRCMYGPTVSREAVIRNDHDHHHDGHAELWRSRMCVLCLWSCAHSRTCSSERRCLTLSSRNTSQRRATTCANRNRRSSSGTTSAPQTSITSRGTSCATSPTRRASSGSSPAPSTSRRQSSRPSVGGVELLLLLSLLSLQVGYANGWLVGGIPAPAASRCRGLVGNGILRRFVCQYMGVLPKG